MTADRLIELMQRSDNDFKRKGLLTPNPSDPASNTVHNFNPTDYDPAGPIRYEANPSRFQLTRTEADVNKYYTYISLELGTLYLQVPTSDRWGMTTDHR